MRAVGPHRYLPTVRWWLMLLMIFLDHNVTCINNICVFVDVDVVLYLLFNSYSHEDESWTLPQVSFGGKL